MRRMHFSHRNSERGMAAIWVIAVLMLVGVIAAAVLQLAPVTLRMAVRDQERVQALDHAESGVAYALAWMQDDRFDPVSLWFPTTERQLGEGGFRNLVVSPRGNGEFVIAVTGYVPTLQGGEVSRRVETAVQLFSITTGSVFYTHVGRMSDPNNDHIPVDIDWGSRPVWQGWNDWDDRTPWETNTSGWTYCSNYNTDLRSIGSAEQCRWGTSYDLTWAGRESSIVSSNVRMEKGVSLASGWSLAVSNSEIIIDGPLDIAESTTTWSGTTLYVDGDTQFSGGKTATFTGPTAIRSNGTFSFGGSKAVSFVGPTDVFATGRVDFGGSGDVIFAGGPTQLLTNRDLTMTSGRAVKFGGVTTLYSGGEIQIAGSIRASFDEHATIYSEKDMVIGGSGHVDFNEGVDLVVGGNLTIGGSGRVKMHGGTTIYVDGDLTLEGSGSIDFGEGATFYVNGDVTINGSAWAKGAPGGDPPWVVVYVGGGLKIEGSAQAGSSTPDYAFLLSTAPSRSHQSVEMTGSTQLRGGIYAPTRDISIAWSSEVWGSLIGNTVELANSNAENTFQKRYHAREERMRSFFLQAEHRRDGSERLLEWREVEPKPSRLD